MEKSTQSLKNADHGKLAGDIAALLGDKARFAMLWQLLDGRAYTATELSVCAEISAQSASNHLFKLVKAKILNVEKQGRHRYYVYSSAEVPRVLESVAGLVPPNQYNAKLSHVKNEMAFARTCYDHLAGKAAVAITDSLLKKSIIRTNERNYTITPYGAEWFAVLDISIDDLEQKKRKFAYPCLDWSERRHHIAGSVGAAILSMLMRKKWIMKKKYSREIIFTQTGQMKLKELLDIDL